MLTQMSLKVKYPNLDTASALTAVENRIPIVSIFVKKLSVTQKLMKLKRYYHGKYITTPKF